jgi:hypothetical protein
MQVFICYSRADKQFANQLVEDLAAYDLTVWMDVHSIPSGSNWDMEVQKGLEHSDILLVLLSPESAASQNVADEWSYFIEHDKPIIPLLIKPTEVPFRLSRRQRVDFTPGYESGFRDLIKALGSPAVLDPDSTQKIRPPVWIDKSVPAPASGKVSAKGSARPGGYSSVPGAPPVGPEVGVKTFPVIWSDSYNWYGGMGKNAEQGDVMISRRELQLVPRARPIITIPMHSLVSASIERSIDQHLKLVYYGPDGSFQSLVLMGAPKDRRKEITAEVLNLLKLLTGRSLN